MKFHKKVDIDVNKDLYNPIQVKQSDNARYLLFRILDNGVPFDLSNKTVRAFGKKADGKEIYNDMSVTNATKGECELRLTSEALSTPGILQLEIEIKENEDVLTTFLLDVDIKKSLRSSSSIESSNEYTVIEKIIETMKDWINKTKEAIKRVDDAINKIPGKEELIPSIGSNGNWFIGGKDTGVVTSGVIFEVERNTDLDNVKKPGYYKCTDSNIVSTLENCPTDNSFTLFVEDLKQTLSEAVASAGARTWSRSYRNGMWGVWDKNFSEYSRPTSDQIIETNNRKFVTDDEKSNWNRKASTAVASTTSNGLMSKEMLSKLNGIETGANAYKHPSTHPANIIVEDTTHRFVTDVEKANWNSKPAEVHNHDDVYSKIGHTHDYLPTDGKAADSSKLNGVAESTSGTANTIAKRDSNGDLTSRFFKSSYQNQDRISGAIAYRVNNSTDNNIRFCSDTTAIKKWLEASNSKQIQFHGNVKTATITFDKTKLVNGVRVSFMTSNKQGTDSWYYALNGKWVDGWASNGPTKLSFEITKLNSAGTLWFVEVWIANKYRETTGGRRYDGSGATHSGELNTIMAYLDHASNVLENLTSIVEYF